MKNYEKRLAGAKNGVNKEFHFQTWRRFSLAGKIVTKSRQLFIVITDEYRFQDVWASVLNNLSELRLEAYP